MAKSVIRCATQSCIDTIAKYGENYHGVHDKEGNALCERCGGVTHDGGQTWQHDCRQCGAKVEPGQLVGFFVPHRCKECDAKVVAKERAEGRICRRCGTVMSYCCC